MPQTRHQCHSAPDDDRDVDGSTVVCAAEAAGQSPIVPQHVGSHLRGTVPGEDPFMFRPPTRIMLWTAAKSAKFQTCIPAT